MTSTGFAGALARAHGYAAYAHFRDRYRDISAADTMAMRAASILLISIIHPLQSVFSAAITALSDSESTSKPGTAVATDDWWRWRSFQKPTSSSNRSTPARITVARQDTARRPLPVLKTMLSGQPVLSPALIIVCVIMAITAGLIYWVTALGSPWTVPWAAIRAAVQLGAIASVLAAALTRLWSSMLVLAVMFVVASVTAGRRSQASRGSPMPMVSLALGVPVTMSLSSTAVGA